MLMSFEGTIGIYQGEELGQTEAELSYDELTDPPALRYWPAIKGRDGCRTPMVWEKDSQNAGFSHAKPWLPVKPAQAALAADLQEATNDSTLHFYKAAIAFRKANVALKSGRTEFITLPEPLLAFHRIADGQSIACAFNLSKDTRTITLTGNATLTGPHHADLNGNTLTLPGNGFAYLNHSGDLQLST